MNIHFLVRLRTLLVFSQEQSVIQPSSLFPDFDKKKKKKRQDHISQTLWREGNVHRTHFAFASIASGLDKYYVPEKLTNSLSIDIDKKSTFCKCKKIVLINSMSH